MLIRTRAVKADTARKASAGKPIRFIASTPGVKRDGQNLDQDKWNLENYRKNPVVLWAHDYFGVRLPIGRAEVLLDDGNLIADITFDSEDEFAQDVEGKYLRGFLNTVSVGWDTRENEDAAEYDLLDISSVPVPGDPDALMQRQQLAVRSLGLDLLKQVEDLESPEDVDLPADNERAEDDPPPDNAPEENADDQAESKRGPDEEILQVVMDNLDTIAPAVFDLLDVDALAEKVKMLMEEKAKANESGDEEMPEDGGEESAEAGQRAGAVLSKKNKQDLEEAVKNIQSVLSRATVEDRKIDTSDNEQPFIQFDEAAKQRLAAIHSLATGGNQNE